jgi:ribonuclease-3
LNKYKCLPKYAILDKTGTDHKPTFMVSVSIDKVNKVVSEGSSLKNAEEAAALKLLGVLKI